MAKAGKKGLDEKTSLRIPTKVYQDILALTELGVFGSKESEVLRHVLLEGMRQIYKGRLIKETLETRRALREAKGS